MTDNHVVTPLEAVMIEAMMQYWDGCRWIKLLIEAVHFSREQDAHAVAVREGLTCRVESHQVSS